MKTKALLIELIENLAKYETHCSAKNSDPSMPDFLEYMNFRHQFSLKSSKREELKGGNYAWRLDVSPKVQIKTDISILVVLLYRYAKNYIKKALAGSDLKNGEDFSFLITLMTHESLTKIELSKLLVMEKSSGNEIINRLVRMKFIEESPDDADRRSVRIRITEYGRSQVLKVLPEMQKVSKIVTGNLDTQEIEALFFLLNKLDKHHNDIYLNLKNYELNDLL